MSSAMAIQGPVKGKTIEFDDFCVGKCQCKEFVYLYHIKTQFM